ncbi:hypothetical protein BDA99DRAFT_534214 [Phascolomyces articulosus]|uniref:Uncharacterized protein n=1 Tax=Phascolomyces articulosus TaxID=60185 RepID=A0AAD5K716_9FUNG|nr:hypothetical protein BDA99DRAFT_534214 [Phascolomyces articulosus]
MTLSTSSLTHQKWKKSLAMLSKWSPKDKKLLATSPTVLAAATEKVIRHSKTSTTTTLSRPLKSEDLTASQFASYAGIKIQHEDDQEDDVDDVEENDDSEEDEDEDQIVPHTSTTMILSSVPVIVPLARSCSDRGGGGGGGGGGRKNSGPQIWDSAFWQHETTTTTIQNPSSNVTTPTKQPQHSPTSIMMAPARSYASTTSTTSTYSAFSDCSASTTTTTTTGNHCHSHSTSSSNDVPPLVRSHPSVIRKGRFKIVLGNEDEAQQQHQPQQPPVVEWRRKRSCTQ